MLSKHLNPKRGEGEENPCRKCWKATGGASRKQADGDKSSPRRKDATGGERQREGCHAALKLYLGQNPPLWNKPSYSMNTNQGQQLREEASSERRKPAICIHHEPARRQNVAFDPGLIPSASAETPAPTGTRIRRFSPTRTRINVGEREKNKKLFSQLVCQQWICKAKNKSQAPLGLWGNRFWKRIAFSQNSGVHERLGTIRGREILPSAHISAHHICAYQAVYRRRGSSDGKCLLHNELLNTLG